MVGAFVGSAAAGGISRGAVTRNVVVADGAASGEANVSPEGLDDALPSHDLGVVVLGLFIREALHELLAKVFVIEHDVKRVHVIEVTQRARTCNLHTFHVFESLLFAPYFAIVGDLYCAKPVRKNFQRGAAFGF